MSCSPYMHIIIVIDVAISITVVIIIINNSNKNNNKVSVTWAIKTSPCLGTDKILLLSVFMV